MLRARHTLILALLWALFIFVTSSVYIGSHEWLEFSRKIGLSETYSGSIEPFWREYGVYFMKGWHIVEFAILFTLATAVLQLSTRLSITGVSRTALLISVLYGASDEWHQSFVRGRDARFSDVLIDGAGALLAMAVYLWWSRKRRRTDNLATTSLAGKWKGK